VALGLEQISTEQKLHKKACARKGGEKIWMLDRYLIKVLQTLGLAFGSFKKLPLKYPVKRNFS